MMREHWPWNDRDNYRMSQCVYLLLRLHVVMTYEGDDSATTTVNFRSLNACFKKASTVFEWPIVSIVSLEHCSAFHSV